MIQNLELDGFKIKAVKDYPGSGYLGFCHANYENYLQEDARKMWRYTTKCAFKYFNRTHDIRALSIIFLAYHYENNIFYGRWIDIMKTSGHLCTQWIFFNKETMRNELTVDWADEACWAESAMRCSACGGNDLDSISFEKNNFNKIMEFGYEEMKKIFEKEISRGKTNIDNKIKCLSDAKNGI